MRRFAYPDTCLLLPLFLEEEGTDIAKLPVQSGNFHNACKYIAGLNTSLRSFDALHLAVAHANNCTLITADKQLAAAAAMLDIEHYFVSYS